MKKLLALALAAIMVLSMSFGAFADENAPSYEDRQTETAAAIKSFEEAHPELKDQFHLMIADVMDIVVGEYREAFIAIQNRFGEMLEENRRQMDIPEEAQDDMRDRLQAQASILNAGFIAHVKASENRMVAMLRGEAYPEGETDVIATLKDISQEMQGKDDARVSRLKADIDRVLETVERDYDNDLAAWYREVSARPELPPDGNGRPDDESHPPMPPEGEKPEGTDGGNPAVPFNDHFQVIHEALKGAAGRIDARIQSLAQEAPEKYDIPEDTASEAFSLLNSVFILVNGRLMEKLGSMDAKTFDSLLTSK